MSLTKRRWSACLGQHMLESGGATIVLTAIYDRSTGRYGQRGHRCTFMEAGHISQNIYLEATSLGLGTVSIGAFYDRQVDTLMGVDGKKETTIYLNAVVPLQEQDRTAHRARTGQALHLPGQAHAREYSLRGKRQ